MPNIAAVLKEEIARVARKAVRHEIESLKKTVGAQRSQIAQLKRLLQEQQRLLRAKAKAAPNGAQAPADMPQEKLRFSAARLAAQRKRLDLSAQEFGRLVGVTGHTVYIWESGKSRPTAEKLAAIASLRKIGKRELQARLAALG
ncbi:MAG: helix-turn-helix transcriptional regulator [Pseudomonadota bacterium]